MAAKICTRNWAANQFDLKRVIYCCRVGYGLKNLYFDPKMAILGSKIVKNLFENISISMAVKFCTRNESAILFICKRFTYWCHLGYDLENVYFDPKMAILGPQMMKNIFKNIFISKAAKYCISNPF